MHPIKAFVGHSFTEDDAHVVRDITNYLTTLQKTLPNFSWEHAEEPSPQEVDSKVLGLLADKNLFIGICTRKERVVSNSRLSTSWMFKGQLKGKEEDFLWKTSDWIIQEIGLAVGRGLKIILLIEEGVRAPGALQGNLEYIQFRRDAPEKAFGKLLGMISTLSPSVAGEQATAVQAPKQMDSQITEVESPPAGDEWTKPQADWASANFETAVMHFLLQDDEESAKKITQEFLQSEEGKDEAKRRHFLAWAEFIKIRFGRGGDVAALRKIADESVDDEDGSDAFDYLARSYLKFEEFEKAAETFRKAADLSEGVTRTRMLGESAFAYEKAGLTSKASLIEGVARHESDASGNGLLELLKAQVKLAEARSEENVALCAMEQILEIEPSDNETRFSLAFKYSSCGLEDLAAFHYSKISPADRSAVVWNNLGVSLDRLQMPVKSVAAYRKSQGLGETLAVSNIAIKLLDAGFLPEAKEILSVASQVDDHHANIDTTLARAKKTVSEEEEKEASTFAKIKPLSEYGRNLGRALARPTADIQGSWKGPNCILEITVDELSFTASGRYEQPRFGALGFLGSGSNLTLPPIPYLVDYLGTVRGQAIFGTVARKIEGEKADPPTSLLSAAADAPAIFSAWLSGDGNTLNVMERANPTATGRMYTFVRSKHGPA